jgi:hypothetical protein
VIDMARAGHIRRADEAYDTKAAGIVSTQPGGLLAAGKAHERRVPLALCGKVPCKVDAAYGPIAPGGLLTTSATTGHAMVVKDRPRAVGAIVGKALEPLAEGKGRILVLVTLK